MSNPTMIQFADKCVPYEVFVKDLAREIVTLQTDALRMPNDIVSQNKAFKLFGEGNVRRWVKEEKLVPVSKRPGKIEYRVFDLKRLQERLKTSSFVISKVERFKRSLGLTFSILNSGFKLNISEA